MSKTRIIIVLFILVNFSSVGIGQIKINKVIKNYMSQVDQGDLEVYYTIKNDTSHYKVINENFTTLEYVIMGISHSSFGIDCNRLSFLEKCIENNKVEKNVTNSMALGLLYFYSNDEKKLKELVKVSRIRYKSYLKSLEMTIEISKMKFSNNKEEFLKQVNNVFENFFELANNNEHFTYLPLTKILLIWNELYPDNYVKEAYGYIVKNGSSNLKLYHFREYIRVIDTYKMKCKTTYNIDSRQLAFSFDESIGYYDFVTKDAIKFMEYLPGLEKK